MTVDIRLFATLKDYAGFNRLQFELDGQSSVAELLASLAAAYPTLAEALPVAIVAVNKEYAFNDDPISDGDQIAIFPPVSGGTDDDAQPAPQDALPDYFDITPDVLDLNAIVAHITRPTTGAVVTFTGAVRGETSRDSGLRQTDYLEYEAFTEMALDKLQQIADEIRDRWPTVEGVALVQRIGKLDVGDTTVLVACSAGHRDQGVFDAAHYGIDRLKEIVTVWKKEVGPDGEQWIEGHYYPTPQDAPTRANLAQDASPEADAEMLETEVGEPEEDMPIAEADMEVGEMADNEPETDAIEPQLQAEPVIEMEAGTIADDKPETEAPVAEVETVEEIEKQAASADNIPPDAPEEVATVEVVKPTPVVAVTPLEGLYYDCATCGESYPLDTILWRCECGAAFRLQNTPAFDGAHVQTDAFSLWRYKAMLLPDDAQPVSLGEGWTPLLPAAIGERTVYLKMEGFNPSGSFKDRGTAVHVSMLRALGRHTIHDDSSGNAGASLAAYAARAGLQARIYAPAYASPVKLAQIQMYGAELVTPDGSRSDVTHAAQADTTSQYASHVYSPLNMLGLKTAAYEIWEQLGSRTPDAVLVPLGHGTQLIGLADGFRDLLEAGAIEHLPRLIGVQAAACAPLWAAFHGEEQAIEDNETLAEGVRIVQPVHTELILNAIRESGGTIVTVGENAILSGMQELARLGAIVEPTSAVVVPALAQLDGELAGNATVVLSLTGTGFKAPIMDSLATDVLQAQVAVE